MERWREWFHSDALTQRLNQIEQKLDRNERKLNQLLAKETTTMALIDDLLADVADQSAVDDSIIQLVENLVAQLKAVGTSPATVAQLQSLKDLLDANKAKVAAEVLKNTPAAPAP